MTQDEIRKSTKQKVQAVEKLMKQLELTVSAEQMITDGGFIKSVVYYADTEKYEIDEEKPKEKSGEAPVPLSQKQDEA
jgi:N-acetylglucosamine kinase-like BadF-type ATPase